MGTNATHGHTADTFTNVGDENKLDTLSWCYTQVFTVRSTNLAFLITINETEQAELDLGVTGMWLVM